LIKVGINIVKRALQEPLRRIKGNAGEEMCHRPGQGQQC
jgi:hypothetical protein